MARQTRRAVLAALGSGIAATAGCGAFGRERVDVLVAGSLQKAASETLQAQTDVELAVEARGSVQAARLVADGKRDPAIVALADPALFDRVMDAAWHAVVASNEMVLAYNPETDGGTRVAAAEPWYGPLRTGSVSLGRTDPRLDPLGYRTLFTLDLAADYYDEPDLADAVLSPDQTYPETQLLAQFETGAVNAAFVYRSMAMERDYPFREFPAEIHLGDPAHAERYRTTSYELPNGTAVAGNPIEYGAVRRDEQEATRTAFETVLSGDWLAPHGFTVRQTYPRLVGDVPSTVTR
ncbi:ABC transporter substrate-binding protein [Haloarcula rubripromontorii]|uniref:ABC transporter substrate-binding protein n=1 Tax=Haloarcula rubripromontorii TaxID=1705562 RepID=A0A0M9AGV8_9EURY|nr:extracellular solute-binding protein [Haloarcula rubripromontorii]KOX91797.1 ABC transporter substrate-binding protein [Haloarcula rubripromontorii]